jgi:KUP system potassium uptake protein
VLLVGGPILALEGLFLAANLTKLVHGAWLPLLIGVAIFTVFTTWQRGRQLVTARREAAEGPLRGFVDNLHQRRLPVQRVPGTAVFLNRGRTTTPLAMRSNVEHNHVLHERVVIVAVETIPVPIVRPEDLAVVDDLGYTDDGITHATISVGYMQQADVPGVLAAIPDESFESPIDVENASYFLSTIDIGTGDGDQRSVKTGSGMPRWRRRLFVAIAGLTADAADYFNLPRDRTVIIGSRIRL